jgi:hypothetical protein
VVESVGEVESRGRSTPSTPRSGGKHDETTKQQVEESHSSHYP